MDTEHRRPTRRPGQKLLLLGILALLGGIALFMASEPLSASSSRFNGQRVVDQDRRELLRFTADKISILGVGLIVVSVLAPASRRLDDDKKANPRRESKD